MKKLIAFRSGKFLLITENLASLASRAVQKKKSRMRGLMISEATSYELYDLFYWFNSLSERDTSLLLRETIDLA